MQLEYCKDICGNEILQDETGEHQVMMEWEKSYMEACIDKLDISGSVLEIGFGLGYSAHRICSSPNIKEYTVIECCPVVWEKVEEFKKEFPNLQINLVKGRWQDVLCTTGKYDRCFFDDYSENINSNNRFNKFLYNFISYHSNPDCKLGLYSETYSSCKNLPFLNSQSERFHIDIPSYCKYAKGNKMYINVITKIREPTTEELFNLKKSFNRSGLIEVPGTITTTNKTRFTIISGTSSELDSSSTKLSSSYMEIEDLYFSKKDMNKLDLYCTEYLQENTKNNREQRMVKFYQGHANFYSNPAKSKAIYENLLENDSLEKDIKDWVTSNLSLLCIKKNE